MAMSTPALYLRLYLGHPNEHSPIQVSLHLGHRKSLNLEDSFQERRNYVSSIHKYRDLRKERKAPKQNLGCQRSY